MTLTHSDIEAMSRIPRLTLINAITGYKSANLIGSIGADGVPNLAIFSSAVHLGSDPALLGIVTRPVDGAIKLTRHTYRNIHHNGHFTINHVHLSMVKAAHQTSAPYPDEVSEFEAVGLTPLWRDPLKAPYVAESRIRIGLEFVEEYHIKANNTILMVGRVLELELPDGCMDEAGNLDLKMAGSVALSGLDTYHDTQVLHRLPYARI